MRIELPPFRRSPHPLLRMLGALLGAAALIALLAFGAFALLLALLVVSVVFVARQVMRPRVAARHDEPGAPPAPAPPPGVIEGEFVIVRETREPPR
ncbi:MAG: hypothetical protein KGI40_03810 [Xanthomonadaceae bacterium]|nr:hypothetical protein [Xanthomonadaceae bacterium]